MHFDVTDAAIASNMVKCEHTFLAGVVRILQKVFLISTRIIVDVNITLLKAREVLGSVFLLSGLNPTTDLGLYISTLRFQQVLYGHLRYRERAEKLILNILCWLAGPGLSVKFD